MMAARRKRVKFMITLAKHVVEDTFAPVNLCKILA
jgi:hypothetical protein